MSGALRLSEDDFDRLMAAEWRAQNAPKPALLQPKPIIPRTPKAALTSAAGRLYPLVLLCEAEGLPAPIPEYLFAREFGRMWRADYAWPAQKIICEIDGGVFTHGRHTRGEGFIEDQRKLNAAAKLGYRVLRYTPDRLGEAVDDLRAVLR